MATETHRRTVGTSAELLYAHPHASQGAQDDFTTKRITLINVTTTQATVILGDDDVTDVTGARWTVAAGRSLSWELERGEALYGIVASGSQSIDVLVGGR